jgi:hypothetical protein
MLGAISLILMGARQTGDRKLPSQGYDLGESSAEEALRFIASLQRLQDGFTVVSDPVAQRGDLFVVVEVDGDDRAVELLHRRLWNHWETWRLQGRIKR